MDAKMKTVLLCQDATFRSELSNLLLMYNSFDIVAEFSEVDQADKYLLDNSVDVAFIEMASGNSLYSSDGSFLACHLSLEKPEVQTVLMDADAANAYGALSAGAADFLKVPIDVVELQRVVKKLGEMYTLREYKRSMADSTLMVKTRDGYKLIQLSDILFIERVERKINVVCKNGEKITIPSYTMNDLEQLLSRTRFYRCHKSVIVNLDNVIGLNVNPQTNYASLMLLGYDKEISISRQKRSEVVALLQDRSSVIKL